MDVITVVVALDIVAFVGSSGVVVVVVADDAVVSSGSTVGTSSTGGIGDTSGNSGTSKDDDDDADDADESGGGVNGTLEKEGGRRVASMYSMATAKRMGKSGARTAS